MNFKEVERERYNNFNKGIKLNSDELAKVGPDSVDPAINSPYIYYHKTLENLSNKIQAHLDICCGDGIHSFTTAKRGCNVTAIDYSLSSIELARKRSESLNINVKFLCCDFEKFEVLNDSFDLITIVGSLSYLDLDYFLTFCNKALKAGGSVVILDSFNFNPIYRLNRYIHYLKGNRSSEVNKRIPNRKTIRTIESNFFVVDKKFFGTFSFMYPIFRYIFPKRKINSLLGILDKFLPPVFGFKFVLIAKKQTSTS